MISFPKAGCRSCTSFPRGGRARLVGGRSWHHLVRACIPLRVRKLKDEKLVPSPKRISGDRSAVDLGAKKMRIAQSKPLRALLRLLLACELVKSGFFCRLLVNVANLRKSSLPLNADLICSKLESLFSSRNGAARPARGNLGEIWRKMQRHESNASRCFSL